MHYKYDQYDNYVASLPNGGEVDDNGNVRNPAGRLVHNIQYPRKEVLTPLTWETRTEVRVTVVTCYKLTGTHYMDYPGNSRESSDGYRGASTGGRGRLAFTKDKYSVKVSYQTVIATNNLGEEAVYSADIPSDLSYQTGYGKLCEYTLDKEAVVPPLPSEKVECSWLTGQELLQYFYDKGVEYFEANPDVPEPPKVPSPTINVGDTVQHPTYGAVIVRSVMGDTIAVHSPKSGVKIVMISSITI
ncbi:hypothetical protein [Microcoleus phage My-WqHQDG]|nr:hypothetical protein [Microcoleus phage My-WqHQDG]